MVASAVIKAGLAPDSYLEKVGSQEERDERTKSKIMIGIMKGAEVGLPPITALSTIAIINGRPVMYGDGIVALIQNSGLLEKMEIIYEGEERISAPSTEGEEADYSPRLSDFTDDFKCIVRMWRVGQTIPYEGRFSVRDAKRAHLWGNTKKTPWIEYPKRQMKWRAFAWPARDGFADCLMGLSIREEVEDMDAPPIAKTDTSFLDSPTPGPSTASAVPPEKVAPGDSAQAPADEIKTPAEAIERLGACTSVDQIMQLWHALPASLADDEAVYKLYEARRDALANPAPTEEGKP